MDAWLQFLERHGAQIGEAPSSLSFGKPGSATDGFIAPLTDLGLIAATGDDAASFLHNQVTNDVEHLGPAEARLAGYCSPKGRLLATFLLWKADGAIMLALPREIQAAVQKRLQMFVLRAKVKLHDVGGKQVVLGLVGKAAADLLSRWFAELPTAPYGVAHSETGTLIRLADADDQPRFQWVARRELAEQVWPILAEALPAAGPQAWRLTEIRAGIPRIVQATQEQFVPQMVNFELIGGVNFRKGCYPGQEIVARSQYLGKLKRRMAAANVVADAAQPGMEVYSEADPGQPCGMIVNAERNAEGRFECLVEIKTATLDAGAIRLGSAQGPALQFTALPYPVSDAPEPH
jgi:folate-binding protein YgfZ